ncbi:DMT family transporter [Ktedonobacter racemifer]|uniref:EamA domain-containing protein n=1 Tax=Ktedonobacter racemifer DSM 44963 TaxID=485913 RepID=D6TLA7_KTERA|nr:DMT family transporter [Ktedonobacter racemifer]EFH86557.1 protein of unknown function DUF6 transmembrane [Ktedonobacter racemifer DSM 44963]
MKTRFSASPEASGTSTAPGTSPELARRGLLFVCIAVIFFGSNPVFVRWAAPFSSLEIAFWRLAIATLLVALMGLITHQPLRIARGEIRNFAFYGLVTALHFVFYISSLSFTTIAHSLALTYTSPIFVTLFSVIFLKEPLPKRKYVGIGVAVLGVGILAGFEPNYTTCNLNGGRCMILGDGLAILSALCFGIYSIAGRSVRDAHPLFRYTTNVYGFAALWLLPIGTYLAFQHSYSPLAIASVVALGVFPLGLGHTLYNAAIRYVHATYANLIATQEVTIGIILGIIFFHEIPSWSAVIGIIITLLGITSVIF